MPTSSIKFFSRTLAALLAIWLLPLGAQASVDDFYFDSFDAKFEISSDKDGVATLEVKETLVAVFPEYDQNRGLIRYLPSWYNRMPLETEILSLTDGAGNERPLETFSESGYLAVDSVVPKGEFLYGAQTFVLSYRQKNVIGDFTDSTGFQEFYWDINGSGWSQDFETVRAQIQVDDQASAGLVREESACYFGFEGETNRCKLTFTDAGDSVLVLVEQQNLSAYQTVTVSLAFEPGTFLILTRDPADYPLNWLLIPLFAGLLASAAFALRYNLRVLAGAKGRKSIVAEYLPPEGITLEMAAQLLGAGGALPVAKLLELAVAGKIHLKEIRKSRWSVTRSDVQLSDDDVVALKALFGQLPEIGVELQLPKRNNSLSAQLVKYGKQLKVSFQETFTVKVALAPRLLFVISSLVLSASGLTLAIISLSNRYGNWMVVTALVGFAVLGPVGALLMSRTPLNALGAETRDHLKGLKIYMKLAERDRLAYLQSPSGALRVGEDDYLKLHERLLPWAILLGLGKAWTKELSEQYGDDQPFWITSTNSSQFAGTMKSLSSGTTASFGSSTSGGAGGGGGGGGGGGR